jgi:hypothetical protein
VLDKMTRNSLAGRAVSALVVLTALSGLTACSPRDLPLTAIRAVDGQPVLLLAGCPDLQIDSVSVYPESVDAPVPDGSPTRELDRTGPAVPESMPLFGDPPPGWTADDGKLTALAAGQAYGLMARADNRKAVPIVFTDADLAALGPDEVLVGKSPSSHKKVTEQEFRKQAKKAC